MPHVSAKGPNNRIKIGKINMERKQSLSEYAESNGCKREKQ